MSSREISFSLRFVCLRVNSRFLFASIRGYFLRSLRSFLTDIALATSVPAIPVCCSAVCFCAFCAFLRLFLALHLRKSAACRAVEHSASAVESLGVGGLYCLNLCVFAALREVVVL